MNKKEEKFFSLLMEDGDLCHTGGQVLGAALQNPEIREDAFQKAKGIWRTRREQKSHIRGQLEKLWSGEQRITAGLLIETTENILLLEESFGRLLALGEGQPPEAMETSMELVLLGLEELKKIFAYSRTLQENYMKAEARHQKIANYEARNSAVVLQGLKRIYMGDQMMPNVFWKDGFEITNEILEETLEAASLFQQLMEDHL